MWENPPLEKDPIIRLLLRQTSDFLLLWAIDRRRGTSSPHFHLFPRLPDWCRNRKRTSRTWGNKGGKKDFRSNPGRTSGMSLDLDSSRYSCIKEYKKKSHCNWPSGHVYCVDASQINYPHHIPTLNNSGITILGVFRKFTEMSCRFFPVFNMDATQFPTEKKIYRLTI